MNEGHQKPKETASAKDPLEDTPKDPLEDTSKDPKEDISRSQRGQI
jgi:hypothetical protein